MPKLQLSKFGAFVETHCSNYAARSLIWTEFDASNMTALELHCDSKKVPFHFLNISAKNEEISILFGAQNRRNMA